MVIDCKQYHYEEISGEQFAQAIKNKTIIDLDIDSCNFVHLKLSDGSLYAIESATSFPICLVYSRLTFSPVS